MLRHYIVPLRDKRLLHDIDVQDVFINWELLLVCHQGLLRALERAVSCRTVLLGECLCDVLGGSELSTVSALKQVLMGDFAKNYAAYCTKQPAASQLLNEERKRNAPLDKFLSSDEIRDVARGRVDIGSLLIKPVQRMLKVGETASPLRRSPGISIHC